MNERNAEMYTAQEVAQALFELINAEGVDGNAVKRVATFEDEGLMTRDEGVVFALKNGAEFQVTVVRSKPATDGRHCSICDEGFDMAEDYGAHLMDEHGFTADEAQEESEQEIPA